jgi:hypothetical protein
MDYQQENALAENKTEAQLKVGRDLLVKHRIRPKAVLESCSTCHR